jgi:hypothetical protein
MLFFWKYCLMTKGSLLNLSFRSCFFRSSMLSSVSDSSSILRFLSYLFSVIDNNFTSFFNSSSSFGSIVTGVVILDILMTSKMDEFLLFGCYYDSSLPRCFPNAFITMMSFPMWLRLRFVGCKR